MEFASLARPTLLTLAALLWVAIVAGCATAPLSPTAPSSVAAFSSATPQGALPVGWGERRLSRFKKETAYRLVADATGITVIEARAEQSASGLAKTLDIDPVLTPWIRWRWQVPSLIQGADNTSRHAEDAPVRVIVTFAGDMNTLDFEERAMAARVKALTGQTMPYATLMYIWENKATLGEIIESPHTSRVKMIVAETGATRSRAWLDYERHIIRDFEKAFGEKPKRILSVGIMTDTDNTGETATAYYGDIRFTRESVLLLAGPTTMSPQPSPTTTNTANAANTQSAANTADATPTPTTKAN